MPHATQLLASQAGLLIIDVQEKLMAKIPGADTLIRNCAFLVDGARLLEIPVMATEQYPKGLGPTVPELGSRIAERAAKIGFSCCAVPDIADGFRRQRRTQLVLAGIESHVCVLNSALDLLAADFTVFLAVDAMASRGSIDHETALRRLEKAGAILTTAETALFEMARGADHPQFKKLSALVQERMKAQ